MGAYNLESVYDEQIAPQIAQIIAICKEHQMPFLANAAYAFDGDKQHSFCTTYIPTENPDRLVPEHVHCVDVLYNGVPNRRHHMVAMTAVTGDSNGKA